MVAAATRPEAHVRLSQSSACVHQHERKTRARPRIQTRSQTQTRRKRRQQKTSLKTAAPTDEDQVLAQLRDIEHEWTTANLNADKQKLDRILADDYVGPSAEEGRLQGKKEYINTIQRDTDVDRWEFDDLKVHLSGDRATLTGSITYIARSKSQICVQR